ncbi:uncharacterized protein LOC130452416 [Diorhabda sublineata]|uniref:uncharacterized protein LOC130452416 n=1 Tax=Diorhabda sublineata TaxID=1163346 RepID=UPI0024E0D7C2|nr:uncharacterized protein LOC130452416 [Diorhabda sublineata]
MKSVICSFILLFCMVNADVTVNNELYPNQTLKTEKKLSETIRTIINHYKQPDPLGIPGAPIPDPMPIPDMRKSFSVGTMYFKNMQLTGLKKFRIEHVLADITKMKVNATLSIDVLVTRGNYTLRSLFSRGAGPFSVTLTKVVVTAVAKMEILPDGSLEAQDMDMDLKIGGIELDFKGMGLLQGVVNSVGTFVFDSIKPFVLREANTNMRNDMNKEIKKLGRTFPNSISPFDHLVYELRRKVRDGGFDPYLVPDYNNSVGIFDIYLTNTWLHGLASFHRVKDIKFEMKNKTVHVLLEVGTGQLLGTSNWELSLVTGLLSKEGTVSFSVEYIKVLINASQSMDISHPPSLDDIQLELGNIQIRFDGLGTVDYLIEFGVNVIPNLLRYQIMDAIEKPIIFKIQEALNQVNVEDMIIENAEQLDSGKGLEDMELILG